MTSPYREIAEQIPPAPKAKKPRAPLPYWCKPAALAATCALLIGAVFDTWAFTEPVHGVVHAAAWIIGVVGAVSAGSILVHYGNGGS